MPEELRWLYLTVNQEVGTINKSDMNALSSACATDKHYIEGFFHERVGDWVTAKLKWTRRHYQHQISHYCTEVLRPRVIVIENLNVSGMLSNHHLAKAIANVGFYEIRRQIEYKAARLGIEVIVADQWYASSKTCSGCGCRKDDLTLSDRVFRCEHCGLVIDRDVNAARNLASLAD